MCSDAQTSVVGGLAVNSLNPTLDWICALTIYKKELRVTAP